jgi:hypothetical protein
VRFEGAASDELAPEPLSAYWHLLTLSTVLMQEDDQARILVLVADAVESLGPCRAEGVLLPGNGKWHASAARRLTLLIWLLRSGRLTVRCSDGAGCQC